MDVHEGDTVADLKRRVAQATCLPVQSQCVSYNHVQLADTATMGSLARPLQQIYVVENRVLRFMGICWNEAAAR